MTTEELSRKLNHLILDCQNPVPYCTPEDGLRFFIPLPAAPVQGTVFAGSYSDWEEVYQNGMLYDGCTYLICRENTTQIKLPRTEKPVNLFLLNAPVPVLLRYLTDFLPGKSMTRSTAQMFQDFWTDILSLHFTSPKQVEERMKDFPFPMHTYLACIVIRRTHPIRDNACALEIQQALQNFFPETNLFLSGNEWIILFSQKNYTSDRLNISYDGFSELLARFHLYAGISYASRFPELLRTLYFTAAASIDLGKGLSIPPYEKRIYTYQQYNAYYIIHLCAQNFMDLHKTENLIYLTHPDTTLLYYYDLENNTNLLDVLYTYLSCEGNTNQTSKLLYMHRNTVLNRLNKITSVLHHDPDYGSNHFLLLLSCMIIKYQQNYMKRNVDDCFASRRFGDY